MNAILKYPGGKWRIANWIISHCPSHKVYLEPFFGSGAVFFNKQHVAIETVNDINGDIVNLFKIVRTESDELARFIELTPFARQEYEDCYIKSDDPLEQARRTLVRYWQSFGTSNSSLRSWKNSQTANSPDNPGQWNKLPEIIRKICVELKYAQIENKPAMELIHRYNSSETFIYCDPPYPQGLRKRGMYKNEMSDDDHLKLLRELKKTKSMVILSGYDCEMYNDLLSDWGTDEKATTAQMGKRRTEKIWFNFPLQTVIEEQITERDI